jgi:hypothetical protein
VGTVECGEDPGGDGVTVTDLKANTVVRERVLGRGQRLDGGQDLANGVHDENLPFEKGRRRVLSRLAEPTYDWPFMIAVLVLVRFTEFSQFLQCVLGLGVERKVAGHTQRQERVRLVLGEL